MAYRIDGRRVSKPWYLVLSHYRRQGGDFRLNSGRRTLSEQWRLYRAYKAGGTLAAYPNPAAPHIRFGRANHALDIDQFVGQTGRSRQPDRFIGWLKRHGVRATRPVPGEPWHVEVPRDQLLRLAKHIERQRR